MTHDAGVSLLPVHACSLFSVHDEESDMRNNPSAGTSYFSGVMLICP